MNKIKYGFVVVLLVFVQSLTVLCPAETRQEVTKKEVGRLYSKSCAMTDGASGRLLYGKEENSPLPNASTTKILTCILALENKKMDDVVTISTDAAAQPKVHLGAKEGEQFYLKDLLYGLMLESYNDCAYAIAEYVGGSVEAFADMMNQKAEELGCTDTHFVTPNGLDREDDGGWHHTTAYDLCRIMAYCAWDSHKSGDFLALTQTKTHSFNSLSGTGYAVYNKNAFLDMMDTAITGKTGFTAKAGYCYVAAAQEGGRRFCIALLGCGWPNHRNYRWEDAKTLFGYGMEQYHLYKSAGDNDSCGPVEIGCGYRKGTLSEWGKRTKLSVATSREIENFTFLKADWEEVKIQKELTKIVTLPVKKGQKIGKIYYCIDENPVYTNEVIAAENVKKWDFKAFLQAVWTEYLPENAFR